MGQRPNLSFSRLLKHANVVQKVLKKYLSRKRYKSYYLQKLIVIEIIKSCLYSMLFLCY